jgi:signal transduction histidine kinase
MKRFLPPGYFLASVLVLLAAVAVYAFSEARRLQRDLIREVEDKGVALAEVLEVSSRNAIQGNALLEQMIGQRLLDNARLIDQLLLSHPFDPAWLRQISAMNRLHKVDLLDREGRPYTPPPPRGMMGMMMPPPTGGPPPGARADMMEMMQYMWGRRWAPPGEQAAPPALKDRKFWEGSLFGVAIGARSFPGIIAVHADADYILNFRKEIGVERQIEELGRQPGIVSVALLDREGTVMAHTDPRRVGQREVDHLLEQIQTIRRPVGRIVDPEGKGRVYEVVTPVLLGDSPLGVLKIGLSLQPSEEIWWRDLRSIIILGLAAAAIGVLGMGVIFYTQHSHLRERRALEAEMTRRERLASLGDMAAALAHEIKNPLNAVSMGLQRLRAEFQPAGGEEYGRFLDLMQAEVRRLNAIVEQFLSLARPLPLKLEHLRVDELLQELAALVEADAKAADVRVNLSVPANLPPVVADRDHLKQVMLNLILNGFQAMPEGGTLTLEAGRGRDGLTLAVADTGQGIPAEALPRVFDPYFTTKAKGLGLGLAIARRIVEDHGGKIEVESRPGRGSRFRVILPPETPAPVRARALPAQSKTGGGIGRGAEPSSEV